MDGPASVELSVEVRCGELFVDARARSPFRKVRLTVGGVRVRSRLGRARWQGQPPPFEDEGERALEVTAMAGGAEARWVADHTPPMPVGVTITGEARSYSPVGLTIEVLGGCVPDEVAQAMADGPLVVRATSPWHTATATATGPTTTTTTATPWGPAFDVAWTATWNGWVVDQGAIAVPLAAPRFDLDGDGRTVREGDPDDHDPAVLGGGGAPPVTPTAPNDVPWTAARLVDGSRLAVPLPAGEERWYAVDVAEAGPLGGLPLRVVADAPVWVEVWDGGPLGGAPPGRLVSPAPLVYVPVAPGVDLGPKGPDAWSFAVKAGEHPPFLTDDVWKAALKPSKSPIWGLVKLAGATMASAVTGVLDLVSAIPAVAGARVEMVSAWSGPSLAAGTRVFVRLTPADASVPVRTATVSLGEGPP